MIKIVGVTHDPISFMGKCAGDCWGADTSDNEKNYARGLECVENNHGRIMEYADVTVRISGYSARVMREIYTHIIGTTRTQGSTRYIDCENFQYFVPASIHEDEKRRMVYMRTMEAIRQGYKDLMVLKTPKEDAANVLPLGMDSVMVLKINVRAILHMAEERTCARAYHEFRKFMTEFKIVLASIDIEWKTIIDEHTKTKCIKHGYCRERYTCGLRPKKLKDGTLLYNKRNAHLCPMYKNSHTNGCFYSPKISEANENGITIMGLCMRCEMIKNELEYDKNPGQKNPVINKIAFDKWVSEGNIAEMEIIKAD